MAQVHRFGDSVAAYLGSGDTVYMSPTTARHIAAALNAAADDVEARTFTKSNFKTASIEMGDDAKHRDQDRDTPTKG